MLWFICESQLMKIQCFNNAYLVMAVVWIL